MATFLDAIKGEPLKVTLMVVILLIAIAMTIVATMVEQGKIDMYALNSKDK